ncbi:MAG: cobalamin-independent methionine synthase II family protein, partial [Candidatus Binatia bacterium]
MLRSEGRILITHAGSLPRPKPLVELLVQKSRREAVDEAALAKEIDRATRHVVAKQLEAGIDVGNDGEQPRESFFTYVQHRMSGFGGESTRPIMRDITRYPTFLELKLPDFSRTMVNLMRAPRAIGKIRYVDEQPLERECERFHRILAA